MKTVTIHEAKTHLSRLIKEVLRGEKVIIAKGSTPLVQLTLLDSEDKPRRIGGARGIIEYMAEDFDETPEDFEPYT